MPPVSHTATLRQLVKSFYVPTKLSPTAWTLSAVLMEWNTQQSHLQNDPNSAGKEGAFISTR